MKMTIHLFLVGLVLAAFQRTAQGFALSSKICVAPSNAWQHQQQQQQRKTNNLVSLDRVPPVISITNCPSICSRPTTTALSSTKNDDDENGSSEENPEEEELIDVEVVDVVPTELGGTTPTTRMQRFRKKYFSKPDDGLTFRQRMAKAGLSVALSYGWVSNVSYSVTVSLAWFIFNKRTGLSPLAPGQWKGFLAVYAGFYVFNNIIRPIRFGLSVAVSVYFDRIIKKIQEVFKVNKGVAIFLTVFLANVVGTCTLMALGISLASMASGVPIFVPKA